MRKKYKPLMVLALIGLLASCSTTSPSNGGNTSSDTGENSGKNDGSTDSGNNDSNPSGNEDQGGSEGGSDSGSDSGSGSHTIPTVLDAIDYVQVFAPKNYTTIYAWTSAGGTKELLGGWPGTQMTSWSENSAWKTYSFAKNLTAFNLIFSENGGNQTADLSLNGVGHYWYINNKLEKTDTVPATQESSSGDDSEVGRIYKEPDDYSGPKDIPESKFTVVNKADTYQDLPVIKNWNKTSVVNKYSGTRDDFRDESIYFTITTRFYDGDKSNNTHCWDSKNDSKKDPNWRGDFKGLIEKMDYIKAQGFTAIWITPIVKNGSGFDYHGYHAINFKEVDPRYESEDVDFQDVINAAHARDMKIILDVVFNHTCNFGEENLFPMFYYDSKNNTSFRGLVKNTKTNLIPSSYDTMNGGQQGEYRHWLMKKAENDVNNIYHHDNWTLEWEGYGCQMGQIAGDCVDLNTENPTVANYLIEAYGKFIQMGVDAFRIDTMKHISRLTLNKYYFPSFRWIANKVGNPNFHMFGEVCVKYRTVWNRDFQCISAPFYTWNETKSYNWGTREVNEASTQEHFNQYISPEGHPTSNNAKLNSGLTYHTPDTSKSSGNAVIDFLMHWSFDNTRDAFNVALTYDDTYNDATYNVVYVDSHDYGPDERQTIRFDRGEAAWKERMSLMFTFRGIPCIYYGSEIEFQKGKTIDNGPNLALANSGRAYFGDNIEGSVKTTGFGSYTSATDKMATTLNSALSKHLQKLNKIRLQVPALRRGQYTTNGCNGGAISFIRRYTKGSTDSVAAVSISGSASFSGLPNGTYEDLYNGGTYTVTDGRLNAPNKDICIYVKR